MPYIDNLYQTLPKTISVSQGMIIERKQTTCKTLSLLTQLRFS